MERATQLHRAGSLDEARHAYLEILQMEPQFAEALHRLGLIAHHQGKLDEAADYLGQAIQMDGTNAFYHYGLGQVFQDKGDTPAAECSYRAALLIAPGMAAAWNLLGIVLQSRQQLQEASQCFRQAIQAQPDYARAHNNLGNLLKQEGDTAGAIASFTEAIRLNPQYDLAQFNLGKVLKETGDQTGAEQCFTALLQRDPKHLPALQELAFMMIDQIRMEEAESLLRRILALKPDTQPALNLSAYALRELCKTEESRAVYQHAVSLDPNNLQAFLGANLGLPPIYRDTAHLAAARVGYEAGLAKLLTQAGHFKSLSAASVLQALQWNNFYLAYQGEDDLRLQQSFARFVREVAEPSNPDLYTAMPRDVGAADRRRVKVGFLSSFLRECTVGAYFKSWIGMLDTDRFEVFVYYTGHWRDAVTREIQSVASHYAALNGKPIAEIARQVKGDGLDVLVYPEIGMDGAMNVLASMRLAPVQCAAWGHPETTGQANIDYYLSCASMEPENADEHYLEKLVRLSGIGTCYEKPLSPSPFGVGSHPEGHKGRGETDSPRESRVKDRQRFSLPPDKTLYLCPQSLYKIHPDNDALLLDILQQDARSVLVFFAGMFTQVTQAFMARLEQGMKERAIPAAKRVLFLPRLNRQDYLQVNRSCDVMLDTLHWSGGNTSLDALASHLPVVTLPGSFMRGRQTAAMLQEIGMPELIAQDRQDYLRIALRLGTDAEWNAQIRTSMAKKVDRLFGNSAPIRELERFLLSLFNR
ncbi:MAG: tetratricopeptide repeat protein [Sulfuricellaceae bacterium]|nr:tetratricopeptide repeat protein [Sulfuricellaceae bacterium]